ncbi:hypothetical protein [Paenibacillus hunanensis]|uniref:Type III secretory pathway component EscR n=1 Tax=Paenibacillus hunanensis TaxID=539262 RepID=A0ABU1IWY2_9BACL|nr:hypothetical protein [Paenibacillus hunanensis]MCL9661195.1 hypothetical protein [Paenibacillus hunanensis]MDR6243767.1 type III secretory pathway component EscR [Paenibacillus hunanensis]WPP42344.1 hypothetical protein SK066_05160 [Paenibacillus hunanensis]GGJ24650.1 hypothetical protein GCM10008022_36970 [Paenibacillus hunanensis]
MSIGFYFAIRLIISLILMVIGAMMVVLGRKFFKEARKGAAIGFIIFGLLVISLAIRGILLNFS